MPTPIKARKNPFRSEKVEAFRYRIAADRLAQWREELAGDRKIHWSIVGPEGTGKTVLLEDLAEGVANAEWIKIRQEDSLAQKFRAGRRIWANDPRPLFLDGAEALPSIFLGVRTLLRRKLVATLHHPRRSIPILHETRFDPAVILELVGILTHAKPTRQETDRILQISRENGGNMRTVIRELYKEASEGRSQLTSLSSSKNPSTP